MKEVETRKTLVKKAIKIGIPEKLLINLTSRSIKKILEYDEEIKREKDGIREVPGYRE